MYLKNDIILKSKKHAISLIEELYYNGYTLRKYEYNYNTNEDSFSHCISLIKNIIKEPILDVKYNRYTGYFLSKDIKQKNFFIYMSFIDYIMLRNIKIKKILNKYEYR